MIYLGRHEGKIKNKNDALTDGNLWISVNECGRDLVRSYSDPIGEIDIGILLNLLDKLKPDLVGFSLRSMFLDAAIEITSHIRGKFDFPVIFGGIAATSDPEKCIKHADMACLGDGEEAVLEIARRIDKRIPLKDVNNLWVREGGALYKNKLYPLEQNLDIFPFPDYDASNKFSIFNGRLTKRESAIGNMSAHTYEIVTSRGCPFSCSYCCNDILKNIYKGQRCLRRRSVENVIAELKEAKEKHKIRTVLFKDEVFTFDLNWIKKFREAYKKNIALPFWCYTHPSFADSRVLNILKDCGMFSVTMGIQSGSESILNTIFNRRTSVEKIVSAANSLVRLNLPVRPRYDIITNNPFETEKDRRDTLELLMRLEKPVDFGLTKLAFIPGTLITKMREDKKIAPTDEKVYKFWNILYLLNQYRFFPNRLIRALEKNAFFRKNPSALQLLLLPKLLESGVRNILERLKARMPKNAVLFLKKIRFLLKGY